MYFKKILDAKASLIKQGQSENSLCPCFINYRYWKKRILKSLYLAPYCSKTNMEELFKMFNEMPNLSLKEKKDLSEAEFNYEHKNYKSCAMLIFSLPNAVTVGISS